MAELILEPTPQAQWQALVHEAQTACGCHLVETLESYLVFLLMRFARQPHCTARIMAEDYLNSQLLRGEQRADRLREVGDHCLLFSGLFPQLAERRLVRISYFVTIGRSSYQQLSAVLDRGWSTVYRHLSEAFIVLMDVLHAMTPVAVAATSRSAPAVLPCLHAVAQKNTRACLLYPRAMHGVEWTRPVTATA